MGAVQREIQFQHVDAGLSQESKPATFGESLNQRTQFSLAHLSCPRHSGNLEFGRSGRDVGIESGAGSGNKVNGNRSGTIFRSCSLHVSLYPVEQYLICGSKVRATAGSGVVSGSGVGWPRVEIARPRKRLTDDSGAHNFSVSLDQLPLRLSG